MTSWRNLAAALVLVAVPVLGGCGGVAPEDDEIFKRAQSDLADARSNPEIRRYAPSALTNADDTLARAREAEDAEAVRRLSYTALQQVRLARELADSRQRERRLMALAENQAKESASAEPSAPSGSREIRSRPLPEERRAPPPGPASQSAPEATPSSRALQYDRPPADPPTGQPSGPHAGVSRSPPAGSSRAAPEPESSSPEATQPPPRAAVEPDRQARPERPSRKAVPPPPPPRKEVDKSAVAALEEKIFGGAEQAEQHPVLDIGGFAEGRADFPPALEEKLGYIARLLQADPSRRISVNGYADDYRDLVKNLRLADARAGAVKEYLTERGVRPSRIWAIGIGDPREADPNSGASPRGVRIVLRSPDSHRRQPENAEAR